MAETASCQRVELGQRMTPRHARRGQSTLEAALFVVVVVAALIAMGDYVRRSIQANLKQVEDRINAEAK